jgi:hypothetical protein
MLNKKLSYSLIPLTLITLISCSGGGGGNSVIPKATVKPQIQNNVVNTPNLPTPSKTPYNNLGNSAPTEIFTEPVTAEQNPDPNVQFASYNKLLRALPTGDFAYLFKEYNAGGLKVTAVKAENDFADYPINYAISSIIQNTGTVGLKNKLIVELTNNEKKNMLEKFFRHILIYGARFTANRLSEFSKTTASSSNNTYTKELATYTGIYFYGNDSEIPAENSIAKMSQQIDSSNGTNTFNQISSGITQIKTSEGNDYRSIIDGKNMIEKGLLKMLYIATLEKAAIAIPDKKASELDDAELYYIGIREQAKSLDNIKTTRIEQLLGDRDFRFLNYPNLEKYLNAGFHEKAINEMQTAINKIDSDDKGAQNSALNAHLYIDLINSSYQNKKFKRSVNTAIKDEMNIFLASVNSKNKELAELSFSKLQTLSVSLVK